MPKVRSVSVLEASLKIEAGATRAKPISKIAKMMKTMLHLAAAATRALVQMTIDVWTKREYTEVRLFIFLTGTSK